MRENDIVVPVARVNGVPLHAPDESPDTETLRQRACTELLRQQAQFKGLLGLSDQPMVQGAISQAAESAIEQLLERDLQLPEPTEEACERYHAGHPMFLNEQVRLRHVLFAVTQGVDVNALRKRAEACLLDLRVAGTQDPARFADVARELSNCPSGREGGDLGWLSRDDCAPEFASDVFSSAEVGVLSRLVHSRFGLHVVEVLERKNGQPIAYADAHAGVVRALQQQAWTNAVRQYLQVLAGNAAIEGVQLDAADSPLVQ
ncbi:peptidylprolyl isomerase [Diaphorobacter sp. HDW4A]|nr:peptidylprolyl isomerase [Diaphorobacter sp. HDW4A]QIL84002.1 peptidylprolyl isomerase [Diaphorobacter sp. HDW4A]